MISPIETILKILSIILLFYVTLVIFMHIISKVIIRKKALKLNSDSVVLLTGGCMGIGKKMAIHLAKTYNCYLIIVDRRKDLFEDVSQQIKKYNGICQCLYGDLSDMQSVIKLIDQIKSHRKRIDLFIYNAGVFIPNLTWQASDSQLNVTMNVNFFSPVKMVKQLMPQLEGGHIAVVSSITSAVDGYCDTSSYICSKKAITSFFNSMRIQLALKNKPITISIGLPYAINTSMFTGFKSRIPLPILDENYVAERLVKQFINRKQQCFIGRKHILIIRLLSFFPTFFRDFVSKITDQNKFPRRQVREVTN